ncbi:IPT/TIG domain-containing protein [Streptomyces brevispora]|uniref:IPT/TIG domain-containing protein n=1 Tax=Streptomyces brevispora TaxID=887462 RepID=A0ABZ1G8K4_9ACTN|nr:IPT/TIG domain-containing protein [Streptomyces brevispora]WSC16219.1 IPT/TIG domain-containing protein [Streptomyces brevispora]
MAVSPNQGSTGGGDAVTLTGSRFTGTTLVDLRSGPRPRWARSCARSP